MAAAVAVASLLASCHPGANVDFDARVAAPAFAGGRVTLLFDQGHHNYHRLDTTYAPFAALARNDGLKVKALAGPLTNPALAGGQILAIVSARADTDTNDAPAFSRAETEGILSWVRNGGSLLLVTDHYPFPNAVEGLANALGLDVAKGMTFDSGQFRQGSNDESRLIFSRANHLLAAHPIVEGRNRAERVGLVETFTGDAFRPRSGAIVPVMRLGATAVNRLGTPSVATKGGDTVVTVNFGKPVPAAGWCQGAAFALGKGRVVVLAEAAMITAQEDGGRRIGMNAPGNDNRQFLLNILNWLGRAF
ncbi:MAG: hypothetical protein QOE79_1365 [Sphingomonadales bacterium]|jgi:hypothetical protein|nr:hypothetical protein [Sphingomonadales bacterium]